MYPNSIYFGLEVVLIYVGTLGPKYILVGYMDPWGKGSCPTACSLNYGSLPSRIRSLGFRLRGFRIWV